MSDGEFLFVLALVATLVAVPATALVMARDHRAALVRRLGLEAARDREALAVARWCAWLSFPGAAAGTFVAVIAVLASTWTLVELASGKGDWMALLACLGIAAVSGVGGGLLLLGRVRIAEGIDRDRARILGGLALCVCANGLVSLPGAAMLLGFGGLGDQPTLEVVGCLAEPISAPSIAAILLGLGALLAHGPRYRAMGRPWKGVSGRPPPGTLTDAPPTDAEPSPP